MAEILVLRGATVIDGWSKNPRPNTTLLIRNQRITAMGSAEEIGVPDGAEVVDLSGKWIIPGLIEMHCHSKPPYGPHFVTAGVTTLRNTSGSIRVLESLRTAPPDAPTPRAIVAGRLFDGPPGMWPGGTNTDIVLVSNEEEARAEVRAQVQEGADLVKLYSLLKPEVARAIIEEAAAHGLPASCDVMYATEWNIKDAARMGCRWNEHASGFLQALYPGFNQRKKDTWALVPWENPNSPELDALCAELVDLGLMLCPTMSLFHQMGSLPNYWFHDTAAARHFGERMKEQWGAIAQVPGLSATHGSISKFNQAIVRAYRRAGGVVVAGTDAPAGCYTYPGIILHRELQLLVANGWSPMEAIQAATGVPAAAMGRTDIGVVRPGAWADLVVLNADPLADIQNTLAIETVIKGGRRFAPDEPLQYVPSAAEEEAFWAKVQADYARDGR